VCELLPQEARSFVLKLSTLRNKLVHGVKHFDFSIETWVHDMDEKELSDFASSVKFDIDGKFDWWYADSKILRKLNHDDKKAIIIISCFFILGAAIEADVKGLLAPLEGEQKRLQGLMDSFAGGVKHGESKSKASQ
jgi:hypothetical protein